MCFATKAMLVKLSISQWTARKHDRKATEHVENDFHVARGTGRFNKALISEEAIKKVAKTATAARTYFYENTLPWSDEGSRILPAAAFQSFSEEMRKLRADFETAVSDFCRGYSDLVADSRVRLNGLFNANDYPANVQEKFSFATEIYPIPDGQDFRVSMANEDAEVIKRTITDNTTAALEAGHRDLYRRLSEAIGHAAQTLKNPQSHFKDTLIENIKDLCAILPALNLKGDPELEKIRAAAAATLANLDPQALREHLPSRQEAQENAQKILDTMSVFYKPAK